MKRWILLFGLEQKERGILQPIVPTAAVAAVAAVAAGAAAVNAFT